MPTYDGWFGLLLDEIPIEKVTLDANGCYRVKVCMPGKHKGGKRGGKKKGSGGKRGGRKGY